MFDPDNVSPAFYNVVVKGSTGEPNVFKPIAHSSGAALSRVLELLDRQGIVTVGKFQYHVSIDRRIGGYDSPDIEEAMRSKTVLENGEDDAEDN